MKNSEALRKRKLRNEANRKIPKRKAKYGSEMIRKEKFGSERKYGSETKQKEKLRIQTKRKGKFG
jgi:hypothetical protein